MVTEKEIINIRIEKALKTKAQKYSSKLGISLSTMIKILIRNAMNENNLVLIPNETTKKNIKDAEIRFSKKQYSGPFNNAKDLIKSLRTS